MARHTNEARIAGLLRSAGWHRDASKVPNMEAHLSQKFPALIKVEDGPTEAGRGRSVHDLFRNAESGPFIRHDTLSIKTMKTKQRNPGSRPTFQSKVDLNTGSTVGPAVIDGIVNHGASYPILLVTVDGDDLWCAMFDLAPAIRAVNGAVPFKAPGVKWGRGNSPVVYVDTARRSSGGKGKWFHRQEGMPINLSAADAAKGPITDFDGNELTHWEFPCYQGFCEDYGERFPVRTWVDPKTVYYAEMTLSTFAAGINQDDWVKVDPADLADFVDSFDWPDEF